MTFLLLLEIKTQGLLHINTHPTIKLYTHPLEIMFKE